MAKIQVISTDESGGGNACEALWYGMAQAALDAGHQIDACISKRSAKHADVVALAGAGMRLICRSAEPKDSRARLILQKVWCRTGARWTYARSLAGDADIRILNVGTLVEIAREPWASLMEKSSIPIAVIVHNNPEIRCYGGALEARLVRILEKAAGVYFVSKRLLENAREQLLIDIPRAKVVKNPVNLTSTDIEPWPEDDEILRIAAVGRLDAHVKGQIRLLHALSSECWKSRKWRLGIFGSGPDREKIEKAMHFYGLSEKVFFGGFVENVRAEIWKNNHALVMPSMLEGMPLTLVEAMVCGRPAVCSDVGGASELIEDDVNGFLAGSPFAKQMEEGLERLWQARGRMKEMGARAHMDATAFLPIDPGKDLHDLLISALGSDVNSRTKVP